jgi:hypothetical protein
MSIKSKVLATVATLALVGGVGTAGVLGTAATANAATPSCGNTCVDIFSQEFGHHGDPVFLLDVWRQHQKIGTPIILFRQSNADPAEDFRAEFQGTVADFLAAALVTPAFALHYGCLAGTSAFPDCFGEVTIQEGQTLPNGTLCTPSNPAFVAATATTAANCGPANFNDPAFEIEYTPLGQFSGLCVGVANTAVQEEGVTLQECGASSKTVWAVDLYDQPFESFILGYAPLINGSDTNFSQPFVLTYPASGYPTDMPRPQLQTDNLSGFTTGFPPVLNYPSIDDNQMWGADFGPFTFED